MDLQLTDTRGHTLEPGLPVAYNLSGEIAHGVIESISPRTQYGETARFDGSPYATIRVRLSHRCGGFTEGHLSKVTNPHNVLVLA